MFSLLTSGKWCNGFLLTCHGTSVKVLDLSEMVNFENVDQKSVCKARWDERKTFSFIAAIKFASQ